MDPRTAAGKEDFHSPYRRFHYAMYHGVPGSHTLFGQGAALESGDDGLSWRNIFKYQDGRSSPEARRNHTVF